MSIWVQCSILYPPYTYGPTEIHGGTTYGTCYSVQVPVRLTATFQNSGKSWARKELMSYVAKPDTGTLEETRRIARKLRTNFWHWRNHV